VSGLGWTKVPVCLGKLGLLKVHGPWQKGTFDVQATTSRPKITVTADGEGVVSHAGSRLLADLADRTTLTGQLSQALDRVRRPRSRHDPGRVVVDLAVAVADGATSISDIAVLADQVELFGPVASDSTCWRVLDANGEPELAAIAAARMAARELAWAQRAEVTGSAVPPAWAAGRALPGLVIDLDATVVVCHSDKEQAAGTFKLRHLWLSPHGRVLRQHRGGAGRAAASGQCRQQYRR
jgi:hypothetical protein